MICNYRIQPIILHNHSCDGVWTDGSVAWIGRVQAYSFLKGGQKTVVLPLTDTSGAYIPAPDGWQSWIIEALDA